MKKTLISFILILQIWTLYAGDFYCKQIGVENGLSQSAITDVVYDGRGALWIGTRFGLNEYRNGKLRVLQDDGTGHIYGNYINFLYLDARENLWVSTDKGLFMYNPSTDSFDIISETAVTSAVDLKHGICFGAHFGLAYYNYDNGVFTDCSEEIYTDYQAIYYYKGKLLTLDKKLGLSLIDDKETINMTIPELVDGVMVMASAIEGDIIYMSLLNYGVIGYSLTEQRTVFSIKNGEGGLPYVPILSMLIVDGSLWMGSDGASVLVLNLEDQSIVSLERQPEQTGGHIPLSVTKLYEDPLGNIWVGSVRSGIVGLKRSQIKSFNLTYTNPAAENVVIDIFPSKDGYIYLGTDGSGIGRYSKSEGVSFLPTMTDLKITSIADFDDRNLIAATYNHGFFLVDRKTSALRSFMIMDPKTNREECFNSNSPALYNLDDGRILFLAAHTFIYSHATRQLQRFTDLTNNKGTEILAIGPVAGGFYAYSPAGLFTLSLDEHTLDLIYEPSVEVGSINTAVYYGGHIWFGTNYGLYTFDLRNSNVRKIESGLFTRVTRLVSNEADNLWIAADNTLFLYRDGKIEMTGENRGVPANEALSTACTSDGTVYLGGTAGFIEIGADCYLTVEENKAVMLRDPSSAHTVVPYNYSSVEFSVNLAGADPFEKVLYRYHLSGASNITKETFEDTITLPALKSGHYKLSVSYLKSDGTWSTEQEVASLHVMRPWYSSIVMIVVYMFLGLALIIYMVEIISRKRVKEMEEKLRAMDLAFTGKLDQYLDQHLSDTGLTVDKIAKDMAMSRAALYYKMSTSFGKGVAEVLEEKRMSRAEELLKSSTLSVLDISEKVGYSTSRYFSTRFKQTHNGMTPLKYRQSQK